jgi:transcriptional regulator with XRE-family HTH domain
MKKTRKTRSRNIVGHRVRQARLRQNPPVSQEDLAARLAARGVELDRSAVSRIESKTRYVMDYEAAALAKALKVSVNWLFRQKNSRRTSGTGWRGTFGPEASTRVETLRLSHANILG